MEQQEIERMSKDDLNFIDEASTVEQNMKLLNAAARDMLDRIEKLEHMNEHQHLAVTDDIAALMKKLEHKSEDNELKISDMQVGL
jgi:hypothetical protein